MLVLPEIMVRSRSVTSKYAYLTISLTHPPGTPSAKGTVKLSRSKRQFLGGNIERFSLLPYGSQKGKVYEKRGVLSCSVSAVACSLL
jgi:hypothetical protein